ncbi:MAG: hypothetical protein JW932_19100 [Deltaproteobacteria bacterium]|nr:hypothetical protein [Deltaproteobacteria bacterium]
MGNEIGQKIFNYIALLKKTNDELVNTLKECVKLLDQFIESVPDPEGWRNLMEVFKETIQIGERMTVEKTLH